MNVLDMSLYRLCCTNLAFKLHKDIFNEHKQKVKVDLQIIAIALANGAEILLSEDTGIQKCVNNLELDLKIYSRYDLKIGLDLFDDE